MHNFIYAIIININYNLKDIQINTKKNIQSQIVSLDEHFEQKSQQNPNNTCYIIYYCDVI